MQLKVESTDKGLPVLIINKLSHTFVNQLRSALQKYNSEVYISPDLPKNIDRFSSIFIIADTSVLRRVFHHDPNEVTFISFTKRL